MPTITIFTPKRFIVAENGTPQSTPQQASGGINKLLETNTTLAVWLIFLAFGGGVLALYYARIGYLPEMEWKAALVYLFIGSVVGGTITLLYTLSVFFPGFIWSQFIIHEPGIEFSYDASPPGNYIPGKEVAPELCMRSIIAYLGLPFLVASLLSHIALPIGRASYWLFAAGILAVMFVVMRSVFTGLLGEGKHESRQVFKCSFWFTLSVFLSQISMYVIYWLSGRPGELSLVHTGPGGLTWALWSEKELSIFIILTLICTTGVWCSNHAVAALHRFHPRLAVAAALTAAGLLLFTADRFSSLSVRLMSSYGFGGETKVTLLMTDDGAKIVSDLGLTSPGTVKLENVEVLSKVGDHYLFSTNGMTFTLPKTNVRAMESHDHRRKK